MAVERPGLCGLHTFFLTELTSMLRIRLARLGRKHRPHYRVVVAESRWARDGRRVDELGHYDPMTDPSTIVLDVARTEDWIRKGAQPSERVLKLLAIARAAPAQRPVVETPAAAPDEAAPAVDKPTAAPEPTPAAGSAATAKATATVKPKAAAKSTAKTSATAKSTAKSKSKAKSKAVAKGTAKAKSAAQAQDAGTTDG